MHIRNLEHKKEWLVLLSLGLICVLIWLRVLTPGAPVLEAVVLDVGQGDSIFIRSPSGRTMLIDGGGYSGRQGEESIGLKIIEPYLRRQGVNRIDVVVLTHPHDDHVQGLVRVVRDFQIGLVLDPAIPHPSNEYHDFLETVMKRRIPYVRAVRGQTLDFGDGMIAHVLNPPEPRLSGSEDDVNNNSIVLRIAYGNKALLFAGDGEVTAEDDILASGEVVRADFLKVGHHGSRDATSELWLRAVRPRWVAISVGRNNLFGHPSEEVTGRLKSHGIKVYRTDMHGAVNVKINSRTIEVSACRGT